MKRNRLGLIALAALAAMATTALVAQSAAATTVTPASTKITATLQEGIHFKFIPKNAYGDVALSCQEVEGTGTTPSDEGQPNGMDQNENQGDWPAQEKAGIGTFSQGQGSVSGQIETTRFETNEGNCTVQELNPEDPHGQGEAIGTAEVITSPGWTIAGWGLSADDAMVAVGAPDGGATINTNVLGLTCTITIGGVGEDAQQTVVMGEYDNENSEVRFDGQVTYSVEGGIGCFNLGEESPAQVEAVVKADNELTVAP